MKVDKLESLGACAEAVEWACRQPMIKNKTLCAGCRDDFYNHNRSDGCWGFATAKVLKRVRVGVWQNPPYEWRPETCLCCYHPQGSVMLDETDCRVIKAAEAAGWKHK